MRCLRCGNEMENTIGGCYACKHCGLAIHDGVYRRPKVVQTDEGEKE